MSYAYDLYLKEHRANVIKGFEWLKQNLPEYAYIYEKAEHNVVFAHDASKDGDEEYDAYDRYFYGNNRSYHVMSEFEYAWNHHIHHNPHHWQHWLLHNDDPNEGLKVLEMPQEYVIEMFCDWWAFSWKAENLMDIFEWYNARRDYIILEPNTRIFLEVLLNKVKAVLDKENQDATE